MTAHIIQNTLSLQLIQNIKQYAYKQRKIRTNLNTWTQGVIGMSGAILLYDLEDEILEDVRKELEVILPDTKGLYMSAIYTLGSRYSFIPWHNDQQHKFSMTIYVNERWDRDWAGMFIHEDGDKITAVYPEFNKAVWFVPPLMHTTVMPNQNAPLRESIQVFWDEVPGVKQY